MTPCSALEEHGGAYTIRSIPIHIMWYWCENMHCRRKTNGTLEGVKTKLELFGQELMYDFAIEIRWRWCDHIYDLCR